MTSVHQSPLVLSREDSVLASRRLAAAPQQKSEGPRLRWRTEDLGRFLAEGRGLSEFIG